ncbi:type I restriction enzyme, S subunit [Nitrosomonas halophila]|uniref:Type I restriction enzyme, S subunit n=2 Tax=Nitrosomonas halophila TaxID=44576 RepID=A0A1H3PWM0_9PROT|nr:type I restriction enzyme, S subunit [Nitrosomonas halophila]
MGSDWQEVTLDEVANEVTVGYVGSMTSEYVDAGVPFLRSKNVDVLRINQDDLKFISHDFHKQISKSKLAPGDVVIVRTGKPGTTAVVPEWLQEANCSDLVIVRCGSRINNRFLAYYVNSVASSHVNAHLVGAVQQHFNVGSAKCMKVLLPDISEQERIVEILGTLDEKIELNRQMNTTLEAMAQALFKSWFVDFDPVIDNALAAGNPIPEPLQARAEMRKGLGEQRKPLPAEIQHQFPSRFVFTEEMGWVPEGWELVPIVELCDRVQNGSTPKRMEASFWEGGSINWFKTGELSDSVLLESEEKITQEGLDNSSCKLWPAGTVLIAIYAAPTVGRLGVLSQESTSNQACTGLVPLDTIGPYFLFYTLLNSREWLNTIAVGAAQQNISKSVVECVPSLKVPENLLASFNDSVLPIWASVQQRLEHNNSLIRLRDTLLPKLLSGQLRIPEAEAMIERSGVAV